MLKNLLIFRLVVLNVFGLAALIWAWFAGHIQTLIDGDVSGILYMLIALFSVGMFSLFSRALKVTRGMNELKSITIGGRTKFVNSVKFLERGEHISDIAIWLVRIGLIGNVVGFAIALHSAGTNADALVTGDGLLKLMVQMMDGMRVAFYTTLVGGAFSLWLDVNRRILKTVTVSYLEDSNDSQRR